MQYLPIVDISRHQGAVNFNTMRAKGVAGLIFRASHGTAIDDRFAQYWDLANSAGYTPDDLTVYTFINPKRGSGRETAEATLDAVRTVVGDASVGYMLDVESYRMQPPTVGKSPVAGAAFSAYLREHADAVRAAGGRVFAYANRAYWNSGEGPNDATLAAELDWIVPRYPVNSALGYARFPLPADASGWERWAFSRANGPTPPVGATWSGWQFSAGYNQQGAPYGCQSSDLDLNIVDAAAWARWAKRPTTPTPEPTPEVTDVFIYTPAGYANAFLIGAGPATHLDGPSFALVKDTLKVPHIAAKDPHPQMLRCILHQSGLTESDLVKLP